MIIHYNCTIGSILLHSFLLIYHPYPLSFHEMISIYARARLAPARQSFLGCQKFYGGFSPGVPAVPKDATADWLEISRPRVIEHSLSCLLQTTSSIILYITIVTTRATWDVARPSYAGVRSPSAHARVRLYFRPMRMLFFLMRPGAPVSPQLLCGTSIKIIS